MSRQHRKLLEGSVVAKRMADKAEFKRNVAKAIRLSGEGLDNVLVNAFKNASGDTVEVVTEVVAVVVQQNDTIIADPQPITVEETASFTIQIGLHVTSSNNTIILSNSATSRGTVTISGEELLYTAPVLGNGEDIVTVDVSNGAGETLSVTLPITVTSI